jgi:crotonobetainyl-CoA:carnitine CoA-transferase CaiB-like acyl-CoA transferase
VADEYLKSSLGIRHYRAHLEKTAVPSMRAFDGIRVIDFTHVLAGPFCTYQLAVMGADVIKIESPTAPDMMRPEGVDPALADQGLGSHFMCQSGEKRSLAVDFASEQGQALLRTLASDADVLVENFRPGVMARAGLDYETLAQLNPALVYCSISGFGQTGPKSQDPAYDNVIQAFSGLMAHTGSVQTAPVRVGPPVLDYGTGAQAAFAIAAALFQRGRSGEGQYIDVAMLDAALMMMGTSVVDTQASGQPPTPPGNSSLTRAGYGCYETSDGLIMIGAFTIRQNATLWRALGEGAIADEVASLCAADLAARVDIDSRALQQILRQQSAQHWEDLLNPAGVPAARVRQLDETLQSEQVAARAVLQPSGLQIDTGRPLQAPVAAFGFQQDGPALHRSAPLLGEHTIEVLREAGIEPQRIDQWLEDGVIAASVNQCASN